MTKEEQNRIIKDALSRNLRKTTEIPEDIGGLYANWVRSKVKEVSAQLVQTQGPQGQQATQGQPEEEEQQPQGGTE